MLLATQVSPPRLQPQISRFRPAEFVHASKGKASEDPLGEREATNKKAHPRKAAHGDYDDDSVADANDEPEYDDDSDAGDDPGSDDDVLFDSEDDGSDDGAADDAMDECGGSDSGYNSDGTDVTMTEDTDKCYTTELDESGEPLRQNSDDAAEPGEFAETKRKYKALCYEDICLWIVQNPKRGERDLLAMEVHLRNYKGVDNKPKPMTFLFRENLFFIFIPRTVPQDSNPLQRMQSVNLICTLIIDITLQDAVNPCIETTELMEALCGFHEVASRYRICLLRSDLSLLSFPSSAARLGACRVSRSNRGAAKNGWVPIAALRR